jgi:hypothetical protein
VLEGRAVGDVVISLDHWIIDADYRCSDTCMIIDMELLRESQSICGMANVQLQAVAMHHRRPRTVQVRRKGPALAWSSHSPQANKRHPSYYIA